MSTEIPSPLDAANFWVRLARQAAQLAHDANRQARHTLSETALPPFELLPQAVQTTLIEVAYSALLDPERTPEQQHQLWVSARLADGWKYGAEIDAVTKRHPDLVPFDRLPAAARMKGVMYLVVVSLVRTLAPSAALRP